MYICMFTLNTLKMCIYRKKDNSFFQPFFSLGEGSLKSSCTLFKTCLFKKASQNNFSHKGSLTL